MMVQAIVLAAAEEFGCAALDIHSERRGARETLARQVAQYVATRTTTFSVARIAQAIGRRDKEAVTHAVKVVEKRLADPAFAARVDRVREAAELAVAELRRRRIGPIDVVRPITVAEQIVRQGSRAAMGASVQEIAAMAECVVAMTAIVDNAAELVLAVEEYGSLPPVDPARPERDELLGQIETLKTMIDRIGILSAVAEQRRPASASGD